MCKKSWGLYIFHYLPIAVSSWYLIQYTPKLQPVMIYAIVAVAGFFGAFLLDEIISRIPIIRWCVLGIKKEERK